MKRSVLSIPIMVLLILLIACSQNQNYREQIMDAEAAFAQMAAEKGIPAAFDYFAADSAVVMRNNTIYKGHKGISETFEGADLENVTLSWKPDFVDVSSSGDLAYTYGHYTMTRILESGDTLADTGIFHTVWKRQSDGSWKYVWD